MSLLKQKYSKVDFIFDANTAPFTVDGTPGRQFGWGNLVYRFGFPPTHHYISAAPGPGEHPTFLPVKNKFYELTLRADYFLYCCFIFINTSFYWNFALRDQLYPLLVVRDDASDEVGLGVVQCGHEFCQRLLVELSYCAEHSLLGF